MQGKELMEEKGKKMIEIKKKRKKKTECMHPQLRSYLQPSVGPYTCTKDLHVIANVIVEEKVLHEQRIGLTEGHRVPFAACG
jgi:hypothetical protein